MRVVLVLALLSLTMALAAVDRSAERDQHYMMARDLVNGNYLHVARRIIDEFDRAGYPDDDVYKIALEFLYQQQFSLSRTGDAARQAEARAKELAASLEGRDLPSMVDDDVNPGGFGQILTLTAQINEILSPDGPPPIVLPSEARIANLRGLVQRLMQITETTLAEQIQAVIDYESEVHRTWEMESDDPQTPEGRAYWAIIQKATNLREEYVRSLSRAYRTLRIAMIRGHYFGLDEEFKGAINRWLHGTLTRQYGVPQGLGGGTNQMTVAAILADWEWNYADYFPPLKHGLAVLRSEVVRLNSGPLPEIRGHQYSDVRNVFEQIVNLDLTNFPRETHEPIGRLQLEVWSDALYWHLAMGGSEAVRQGLEMWAACQKWLQERRWGLDHQDRIVNQWVGHLHLLASQLHHAQGDGAMRDGVLAAVQSRGNFFQGNARGWIGWYASVESAQASPWFAPPRPVDPEAALITARAFLSEARAAVEQDQIRRFRVNAAAQLRSGILGLPEANDPRFIELAPQLYHTYAFTLHQLGWRYHSTIVALEGLSRFQPELWGEEPDPRRNPWFDRRGNLSESGALVRRLASDALSFSDGLSSRASSAAFPHAQRQALDYLQAYDPVRYRDSGEFLNVANLLNQGEYRAAAEAARQVFDDMRNNARNAHRRGEPAAMLEALTSMLTALRFEAQAWYLLSMELFDRDASEDEQRAVRERIDDVVQRIQTNVRQFGDRPELESQIRCLQNFEITIQVTPMLRAGDYMGVLNLLDADYWEKAPRDEAVINDLLHRMSYAVYQLTRASRARLNERLASAGQAADQRRALAEALDAYARETAELWPYLLHGRLVFNRQVHAFPVLASRAVSSRRLLAVSFNMIATAMERVFITNMERAGVMPDEVLEGLGSPWIALMLQLSDDDLAALDAGQLTERLVALDRDLVMQLAQDDTGRVNPADLMTAAATRTLVRYLQQVGLGHYADLYAPLCGPTENPQTNLAVGLALWNLNRRVEAIPMFEYFRASLLRDPAIQEFRRDPARSIEAIRRLVPDRARLRPFWDREDKGSIPDLLMVRDGFMERYMLSDNPADLDEERVNFARAHRRIVEFEAALERERTGIDRQTYAALQEALPGFKTMVERLANLISVDTMLMEAYYDDGRIDSAVAQARILIEYDPLDPQYMAMVIEGTLNSEAPTEEELTQARRQAARLRNMMGTRRDYDYWTVYIQAFELSAMLGDFTPIIRTLRNNNVRNVNPVEDLYRLVTNDFPIGALLEGEGLLVKEMPDHRQTFRVSRRAVALMKRYLGLFDYDQVRQAGVLPPMRINVEEVADVENPEVIKDVHRMEYIQRDD